MGHYAVGKVLEQAGVVAANDMVRATATKAGLMPCFSTTKTLSITTDGRSRSVPVWPSRSQRY
jgi:hypothetical protein